MVETSHSLLIDVMKHLVRDVGEAQVAMDRSAERDLQLWNDFASEPVHTFYQSRFRASKAATSSIEVVCKAVLAGQADGDQVSSLPPSEEKEQAHG